MEQANTEYIKARDAAAEAFVEQNEDRWSECSWWLNDIMQETYAKAADWGRAYESPAVKALIEASRRIVATGSNVPKFLFGAEIALLDALKAYDAERAGSGEK